MGGTGSGRRGKTQKTLQREVATLELANHENPMPEMLDGKPCWERLEGETPEQFAAFQIFRDMPALTRSIPEAWKVIKEKKLEAINKKRERRGLPPKRFKDHNHANKTLLEWAREHKWWYRSDRYDEFLDRHRVASQVEEVRQMATRHISMASLLQSKAVKRLKEMTDTELTPKLVLDYITEAVKIERQARDPQPLKPFFKERHEAEGRNRPVTDGEEDQGLDYAKSMLERRLDQIAKRKEEIKAEQSQTGIELVG